MNDFTEKNQKKWLLLLTLLPYLPYLLVAGHKNTCLYKMEHKRKYRELEDEVKEKISQSTKGKAKTMRHRQNLSRSLKRYWEGIPHRPEHTTMDDLLGKEQE